MVNALPLADHGVANPFSTPACGLPAPVSVNVIAPVRVVPRGGNKFVNRTPTVHDPPGGSVAPVQVSVPPPTELKNHPSPNGPPEPVTATPVTATLDPPTAAVLVSVTVLVPVRAPVGNVINSGFGVTDIAARAATPVPVSVTFGA